jgi:hypothetical protein
MGRGLRRGGRSVVLPGRPTVPPRATPALPGAAGVTRPQGRGGGPTAAAPAGGCKELRSGRFPGSGTLVAHAAGGHGGPPGRSRARGFPHGAQVPQRHLFEVRLLLDPPIAGLAARRATADHLALLWAILRRQEGEVADGGRGLEADAQFHTLLCEASDNPILRRGSTSSRPRHPWSNTREEGQSVYHVTSPPSCPHAPFTYSS